MIFKKINTLIVLHAIIGLSACSATVSDDGQSQPTQIGESVNEKFMDERNTIQGPTWIGHWLSDCVRIKDDSFRRWDLLVTEKTISRKEILFTNAKCTEGKNEKTSLGRYRFIDSFKDGSWNIEYAFNLPNGITSFPQEKIKLENNKVYLSNFYLADFGYLLTDEPLHLVIDTPPSEAPPQEPTPSPPPVVNIPSHSPKTGDEVQYKGTAYGSLQTEVYTTQSYNLDYKDWTVFQDIQGPYPKMGYIYLKELWSTEKYKDIINNCVANKNTLENITVKAGTFSTCKIKTSTSIKWYGNVPVLGLIKIQNLDGNYQSELSSYRIAP